MTYRLPPLAALRAFEAAARHLSFKHAAAELSVTPTAISHQIKQLEDFLQRPLFVRRTRALELTAQGHAMLPKVREGLECFAQAVECAHTGAPEGRLIVVLPPSFATRWLVPRLRSFAQAHPALQLHVIRSLHAIDGEGAHHPLAIDLPDLQEEDSVVVIRFGNGNYAGLQVDRMFGADYIAVCAPRLCVSSAGLSCLQDMHHQVLLHDDTLAHERGGPSWDEWFRVAGLGGTAPGGGPHFSDSGLVYVAALDGLGVALASRPLVATALLQGRLVAPFALAIGQHYAYYLVTSQTVARRPGVQAFRHWLLEQARTEAAVPA